MTAEEKCSPVNSRWKFPGNDSDDEPHVRFEPITTVVGVSRGVMDAAGSCVPCCRSGGFGHQKKGEVY